MPLKNEAITLGITDFCIFIGRTNTKNKFLEKVVVSHNFRPVLKLGSKPGKTVLSIKILFWC